MLLSTLGTLTLGYFGLLWATLGYFGLLLATFLTICVTYGSIIQCDFLKKNTAKHHKNKEEEKVFNSMYC